MIKFNRLILVLRFGLLALLVSSVIASVPLFLNITIDSLLTNFFNVFLAIFFVFTIFRLLRLILKESKDIQINEDFILVKNIITGRVERLDKKRIKGFRQERYQWNIIKISGVRSFVEFESSMVVLYSNYKAILHLKAMNYMGNKKIVKKLLEFGYMPVPKKRYFDVYNYWHI